MFKLFHKKSAPQQSRPSPKVALSTIEHARSAVPSVREFEPYIPPPGVIPEQKKKEALAQDSTPYDYVNQQYMANYFPGYQYLAMLAQLAEYRKFGETVARDMTRKWIKLHSQDEGSSDRVQQLEAALKKFHIQDRFRQAARLDAWFGRGQLYIDLKKPAGDLASDDPTELESLLVIDPAKIKKGSFIGLNVVEPMWTYPSGYNADDPLKRNFYRPLSWYVMGKTVHNSRLLTFISREVPDILKPSYNFGGVSMSQLAQPYVANWLRTRDSVSDLVHSFSVSGIKTNLSSSLTGADDAYMVSRAQLFNTLRDNRGLMMLDKDSEEFFQFNTPLSGLDELQAQSQEHMSSVSNIPLVILTGITPSGLNASSDSEIAVYNDSILAAQEAVFRAPLERLIKVIQLSEFGDIDESIGFTFENLYGLDAVEEATVRKTNAETDAVLVSVGAVSPDEVRARVAADPDSGYNELDDSSEDDDELESRTNTLQVKDKINDE